MTRTRENPMRRSRTTLLLTGGLFLGAAGTAPAQERAAVAGGCSADEQLVGNLGIDLRCDCVYHYDEGEDHWSWYFRAEPKITDVKRDGPSRGRLRGGDTIVAIDGMLITTPRAGDHLANLVPGRPSEVTVRRGGRQVTYAITPDPRCRRSQPSAVRAPTPPLAVTPPAAPIPGRAPLAVLAPTPPLPPTALSQSWFGFGLSCDECSLQRGQSEEFAEARTRYQRAMTRHASAAELASLRRRMESLQQGPYRWEFQTPPRLYSVDPNGPADRAGLRRGDVLTHIDGVALTSEAGGSRLSQVQPGERVALVYRRGDAVRTTTITAAEPPADASRALALTELAQLAASANRIHSMSTEARVRGEAEALRAQLVALQTESELQRVEKVRLQRQLIETLVRPTREPVGVSLERPGPDVVEPVERLVYPLRYSGVLQDVNVVVRSRGSVVVSRDENTGELIITTSDAVIRMKPEKRKR